MSPKATGNRITVPSNPNPNAPETLRPSQLTIVADTAPTVPQGPAAAAGETLTPEVVLARIESELVKAGGMWAKGAKAFNLKTAGQRLHNALAEVQAAEAHAKALRDGMAALIAEGIAAINGTTAPKKTKTVAPSTDAATAPKVG
jgi:hypothetical protein